MTGRVFQYILVLAATILAGIGFSRECAQCVESPKPGLMRPGRALAQVGGELVEPPRLAFHPADAPRVLSLQHEAPAKSARRAVEAGIGASVARQGVARSTWLLVAGGALVSVALILRYELVRDATTEPATAARAAATRTVLEMLIANKLPIVEESLALPHESQIFGRPLLESPYRRHTAHALDGPHFAIEAGRPTPAAAMTDRPVRRAPIARPARAVRVDQSHPPGGPGELDRALAALQGDQP
jgi:hypothetical protein